MGCPPVRGDAHREIFRAKVGKGGINTIQSCWDHYLGTSQYWAVRVYVLLNNTKQ